MVLCFHKSHHYVITDLLCVHWELCGNTACSYWSMGNNKTGLHCMLEPSAHEMQVSYHHCLHEKGHVSLSEGLFQMDQSSDVWVATSRGTPVVMNLRQLSTTLHQFWSYFLLLGIPWGRIFYGFLFNSLVVLLHCLSKYQSKYPVIVVNNCHDWIVVCYIEWADFWRIHIL